MLVQIDVEPRGGAYVNPEAVAAIVPRHDTGGCWIVLTGGSQIPFPGDLEDAHKQLFRAGDFAGPLTPQNETSMPNIRTISDEMTSRLLVFDTPFDTQTIALGHVVYVNVISASDPALGEASRKICQLMVPVHELRRMVNLLETEIAKGDAV